MRSVRWRRGFSMVDLGAVVVIFLVLAAVVPAVLYRARMRSGTVPCASNLRQIGQGFLLYNMDHGTYPRGRYVAGAPPVAFTGWNAPDPFGVGGPAANDVTAALYLLVRKADIDVSVFSCPEDGRTVAWREGQVDPKRYSNFPGVEVLGYSVANPYPGTGIGQGTYRYDSKVPADWAIAADLNPGSAQVMQVKLEDPATSQRLANSRNHGGEGQNVLFNDGHVEWTQHAFVGAGQDNIYASTHIGATSVMEAPGRDMDSVLLPHGDGAKAAEGVWWKENRAHVTLLAVLLGVSVGVVGVWRVARRLMGSKGPAQGR